MEVFTLPVCQMTQTPGRLRPRTWLGMGLGAYVYEGLCVSGVVWRCIIILCGHEYLSLCFQTPRRKEPVTPLPFSARVCARAHVVSALLVTTRL